MAFLLSSRTSGVQADSFVVLRRGIVYTVHKAMANEKWTLSTSEMETSAATGPPVRSTYRHGDLRRALLDAGIELARGGGPDAVVLREATRRAGVVPNAAYRHFASREELLQAVRAAALSALAVAMETELAGLRRGRRRADYARASLRAVGTAYMRFARTETGLFRTAFSLPTHPETV